MLTQTIKIRPDMFSRDYAYRGGAAIARRYGGAGTVTVYLFRCRAEDKMVSRIEAFGKTPADRAFCAKSFVRIELLKGMLARFQGDAELTSAIDAEMVELGNAIMLRGHAKRM